MAINISDVIFKAIKTIKETAIKILLYPLNLWFGLPEIVRISIFITLAVIAILILVIVYKNREAWRYRFT